MAFGKKTGGRAKGTRNRATQAKIKLVELASSQGVTPLDVMLGAMREAWELGNKEAAANFAKDAAPYMHPRLAAVEVSGNADAPIYVVSATPTELPLEEWAVGAVGGAVLNGQSHSS